MSEAPTRRLGRYRILEEIGRGGFGVVYRAEDTSLGNRIVALKVLHPQWSVDPSSVRLFTQEAGTAARLEQEHIVTIHEADTVEGVRYIAMKYLPGPSLADLLAQEGPQPVERVVHWVAEAAAALDHAHREGIVHRDLKPSNLLLDARGQVVVTDFGLAQAAEISGGVTSGHDSRHITGTARYMAPEQAQRGAATPQSDVYALGVVAYELLTGHVPFEQGNALSILFQQVHEPPPAPRTFRPDLPEPVEQVVLRALAKEPGERYQSAGQFARALGVAARQAEEERRRLEELAALYARFLATEEAGDWSAAVALGERLAGEEPGYRDVGPRLVAARERMQKQEEVERERQDEAERQRRLDDLYDHLIAAGAAADWTAALGYGRQLEEGSPGFRDVAERQAHAQAMRRQEIDAERRRLADLERQQKLAVLYDALLEREKADDWAGVVSLARQILAESEDHGDVPQRLAKAERAQRQEEAWRRRERKRQDEARRARLLVWRRRAVLALFSVLAAVGLVLLAVWLAGDIEERRSARATEHVALTRTAAVEATDRVEATVAAAATRIAQVPTVTPTPSPTATDTPSPTPTDTPTWTPTPSPTFTDTPTWTTTPSPTPTGTPTPTPASPSPPPVTLSRTPMVPSPTPTTRTPGPVAPSPRPLTPSPPPGQAAAPLGTLTGRIAFSVLEPGTGTYILYSIKPDGTGLRFLGNHLRQPSYRQDGELIVANGQGGNMDDLWTVSPDGSGRVEALGHLDDEHPVWLQARQYVIGFDSLRWGDGEWRIYVGDAPLSSGQGHVLGRYPVWLPGEKIAYSGCDYGFGRGTRCGLYAAPMWGGIPVQILDGAGAIPTGGGEAGVLYMKEEGGNWDVHLAASGGGSERRLTTDSARDGLATFSPEGQAIAFLSDRSGSWAIWLMSRDGSRQHRIHDLPAGSYGAQWISERISWGPEPAPPPPAPTPTGGDLLAAPTFIWPRAEDVIQAGKPYEIQWSWAGPGLEENQGFEVRLRADPVSAPEALASPCRGTSLGVTFAYAPLYHGPDYYYLDIVVVQISPWKALSHPAGPIRIKLEGEG